MNQENRSYFMPATRVFLVVCLALFQFAQAQTTIQGGIVSGLWTKSASPYIIRGSLLIPNDSTLTIEPGVVVDFRGQFKLNIQGRLVAKGTAGDSIYFTTSVPQPAIPPIVPDPNDSSHWTGIELIVVANTNDSTKMEYCVIEFVRGKNFGSSPALSVDNYSKLLVANCRFSRNGDGYNGTTIYLYNGASPHIVNSTISYNRATGITADYGSYAYIAGNRIVNNSGGGLRLVNCGARVINNLIANNTMPGGMIGAGVTFESNNQGYFVNNTVVNNHSANKGGGMFFINSAQYQATILNCIIHGNTAVYGGNQVHIEDEGSDPNISSSMIQGGVSAFSLNGTIYTGTYQNNMDVDPLFVKASSGTGHTFDSSPDSADWSLKSNSPLIDKGVPNLAYPDYDLAGNPRVNVCRIDMGAFEYQIGVAMRILFQTNSENLCYGDSIGSVTAQVTGGTPPFHLTWSTGDTLPTLNGLAGGTYQLTVNSPANGCSISKDYVVNQPEQLLIDAGNDTAISCNGSAELKGVKTNLVSTAWRHYSWTPSLHLSNDTIHNPVVTVTGDVLYTVEVTNANGCKADDSIRISIKRLPPTEICIVNVTEANKNQVVWNKPPDTGIDSFFIYRETNFTGQFMRLGGQPYSAFTTFTDNSSAPDMQSNLYRLTTRDMCSIESPASVSHKTMHLTINKGLGNTWNLIWELYEGFTVSTHNIYRGTSDSNMVLIGNSSASNTQFTDLTAPAGNLYYQIEIISPNSCNPSKNYNTSRSNIASTLSIGIPDPNTENPILHVYPNPAGEFLNLAIRDFDRDKTYTFKLVNLLGQTILSRPLNEAKDQQNILSIPEGMYVYQIEENGLLIQSGKLLIHRD